MPLVPKYQTNKPIDQAYVATVDYQCVIGTGHAHNEPAWRARTPYAIDFLYADSTRVDVAPPYASDIAPCAP